MIAAGFDYGTSNCALATIIAGRVQFAPLEDGMRLLPSTLWAPAPDLARVRRDRYGRPLPPGPAITLHGEAFRELRFGSAAIDRHLADPANGFYVRSPKSFLGAAGLGEDLRERFRDIVAAMMLTVRERAEQAFGAPLRQVVVGRPVNFQGPGEASHNAQAEAMLRAAAHAAGFTDVAFLFEPLAAALDFEVRLDRDVRALVVDIGGGTTDVSFVELGPRRRARTDRTADVLAHAGERVGGNDFDQLLALRQLMPAFGYGAVGRNGLPVPNTLLVDAVTVNDVNAQARFYGSAGGTALQAWRREVEPAVLLERLATVRERRLSWRIARTAEHAKIALSGAATAPAALDYVEPGLVLETARAAFADQAWRLLERITALVDEALAQAGVTPEVVYLTGGMAGAPMVRARIGQRLPDVPMVDGDHFASVVEGLAHHAHRLFGARGR